MTDHSRANLSDKIKLVGIEVVMLSGFPAGVKVTLTCDQVRPTASSPIRTGESVTASFIYKVDQISDDGLVPTARADFHNFVRDLAAATQHWDLSAEERNALHTAKAQTERELVQQGLSVKLRASS